ncbi:MAG: TolC family protein [Leptospira sp.]|nr:TolC family protein [Leptospira sp.]
MDIYQTPILKINLNFVRFKKGSLVMIFGILGFVSNLNAVEKIKSDFLIIDMAEAEGIGIVNSVILASLKDRREVFKMIATEKWRNYLPRIGLSYFGLKNANVNQPDSQYNDIRIQLNQLLYDGGENSLEIESAKLQELLNQEDWKIVKDKLTLEIRKAFCSLLLSDLKILSAEISYERSYKQFIDSKREREQGFLTEIQLLEISNKLKEIELLFFKAQSTKKQAELELKKQLNLPLEIKIQLKDSLLRDYIFYSPESINNEEDIDFTQKPEFKKSNIAVQNLKTRKEISDNYWKPKLSVGGYYGENVNGTLPVKNEVYGFNFTIQTQLGSSTNQTNTNFGVQTDGTGIQRIPGFGPQFVGRGENAFNSNTLNLFDDLSYSRKIYEGKIALSDAIRSKQLLEVNIKAEIFKSKERLKDAWHLLSLSNSKFLFALETWKTIQLKYKNGFSKESELITSEHELMKVIEDYAGSLLNYMESGFDCSYAMGIPMEELRIYEIKRGYGNSILSYYLDQFEKSSKAQDDSFQKGNETTKSHQKKNEYEFYLEN